MFLDSVSISDIEVNTCSFSGDHKSTNKAFQLLLLHNEIRRIYLVNDKCFPSAVLKTN